MTSQPNRASENAWPLGQWKQLEPLARGWCGAALERRGWLRAYYCKPDDLLDALAIRFLRAFDAAAPNSNPRGLARRILDNLLNDAGRMRSVHNRWEANR